MVLQREMRLPVWGTAEPGERVTVEFAGERASATAGAGGAWRVDLPALQASDEARVLTVVGSRSAAPLRLSDVLVGEVWLASGQSNMTFPMSVKVAYYAGVTNEAEEIRVANYPKIRMFTAEATKAYEPRPAVPGTWQVCSPATVSAFSAIGYFFARDLQRVLNVPIGIVTSAYGASTAEAWIQREVLEADLEMKPMIDRFDAVVASFRLHPPPVVAAPRSEDVSAKPKRSTGPRDPIQDQHNPTVLFNGMIHPLIPYAIRGAIWYQGESIVGGAAGRALYPHVQAALIADWRALWGEGNFPFYIVQLAGQEAESNSPVVREAQATVLQLPNTGMAVTTDIGEAKNVHPHNKQDVGDRLARIALAKTYGKAIEYSGPVYEGCSQEGSAIRVRFAHAAGGLVARGGPLNWVTIAGPDHVFVPAEATIDGATILVRSPSITEPVAVRYAWVNFPDGCNLYNTDGLPAAQFRTDTGRP